MRVLKRTLVLGLEVSCHLNPYFTDNILWAQSTSVQYCYRRKASLFPASDSCQWHYQIKVQLMCPMNTRHAAPHVVDKHLQWHCTLFIIYSITGNNGAVLCYCSGWHHGKWIMSSQHPWEQKKKVTLHHFFSMEHFFIP